MTLAPGETKVIGGVGHNYAPGTRYSNCVALGSAAYQELQPLPPPDRSRFPGPDISCVSGGIRSQAPQCPSGLNLSPGCPDGRPRDSHGTCPTPPTITLPCAEGMRRGFNGQCFFVDPGCQGPNCPPVTSGCTGGLPRNSDGNCPTTSGCPGDVARNSDGNCPQITCPFDRTLRDGKCVCHARRLAMTATWRRRNARRRRKRSRRRLRIVGIQQSSPGFSIGIGIGGGGRGPSRGTPIGDRRVAVVERAVIPADR